ncbi:hypothetical protein DDZ13_13460 [Coraliomargarita sinensis]|uniref:Ribosomal RNA small subunit methyltransferase J n=1 Tax=Coraliomargarita sinensis TaxID=2174842 RepID=A0A317ZD73_9BACT|nr:class I SAM-dependent methyltransferase [Coraliomargarita sinensis]PXA03224.1 hypothetical protein DDZ13_13460 [Coraliomargarita sinensis]
MEPAAVYSLDLKSLNKASVLAGDGKLPLIEVDVPELNSSKQRLRLLRQHLSELPALVFVVESDVVQLALIEEQSFLAINTGFHGSGLDYRRHKGGGRSELIAKAVGLKGGKVPTVIDATAGLGVDAFVLASLGCQVTLIERVPAVAALLRDGLERSRDYAGENDTELEMILKRMQLVQTDAIAHLDELGQDNVPDVVYLDPMFPERKKSAAVKKEMQIFHRLVGPDDDTTQLFEKALFRARDRVVVKRPRVAPALTDRQPSHIIEGKRNRYDVYLSLSAQP